MAVMPELKLFLFGPPRFEYQGETIDLGLRKAMALITYLAITKRDCSRDEMATLLWPESSQSSARASLRRSLYHINKTIEDQLLLTGADTISLDPNADLWCDVDMFKRYLSESTQEHEHPEQIDPHRLSVLEEAVALYQGDLLEGFSLPGCISFDEWLFFEAESLRESQASALMQLSAAYQAQGKYDRAILHARRWLSLDSLHEPAHRLLMVLYAESGQRAAAMRQYEECVRILEQELMLSPQAETTELYQNIRLQRDTSAPPPAKTRPQVRYVASGDVHIAYIVFGDGPVDILVVSGFITHMEKLWRWPSLAAFFEELASFSRVILFDRRGVGLSERVGYPPNLEDTTDDMLAVMRAAGSKHAVLFGFLEGGPNSMVFTATYPERVSGLILYGTCAKWTKSEDYPWALTREQYDLWVQQISENWGAALNIEEYAPSRAHDAQLQNWWADMMRSASSPGGIKAVVEVMREIDVRDILPAIRTPTLVLHRKGDRAVRIQAGRFLSGQIPGVKYVELEGQDHWFFIGDSQSILSEMKTFVQNLGSPVIPERMLATILLVELLDSMSEDASHKPLEATHLFLRQEVGRFRGSEVSGSQGCYTATFDGPSKAIQCAKAILDNADQRGINMRAGLHTGECEFVAGELVGTAVQIAEGVVKTAAAGEILASSTVKDLVVGSGLQFAQRDQRAIKGVSGQWGIFLVQ
jgi:DNA-binding SARP family transcriptional activator/pimeloyl-ACP methyl ester carboxylesterase